MKANITA